MNSSNSFHEKKVENCLQIGNSINISSPSSTISGLTTVTVYTEASIMTENDVIQAATDGAQVDRVQIEASTSTSATNLPKTQC